MQAGDEDGARQYLTEKVNYEVRVSGSQKKSCLLCSKALLCSVQPVSSLGHANHRWEPAWLAFIRSPESAHSHYSALRWRRRARVRSEGAPERGRGEGLGAQESERVERLLGLWPLCFARQLRSAHALWFQEQLAKTEELFYDMDARRKQLKLSVDQLEERLLEVQVPARPSRLLPPCRCAASHYPAATLRHTECCMRACARSL